MICDMKCGMRWNVVTFGSISDARHVRSGQELPNGRSKSGVFQPWLNATELTLALTRDTIFSVSHGVA